VVDEATQGQAQATPRSTRGVRGADRKRTRILKPRPRKTYQNKRQARVTPTPSRFGFADVARREELEGRRPCSGQSGISNTLEAIAPWIKHRQDTITLWNKLTAKHLKTGEKAIRDEERWTRRAVEKLHVHGAPVCGWKEKGKKEV